MTGSISIGGPSVTLSTTTAYDNGRLSFNAVAGQVVSLNVTGITYGSRLDVWIYTPGNTVVSHGWASAGSSSTWFDQMLLTQAGTYSIFIDPNGSSTGSATYTLYDVHDLAGTIAPDGVGVRVTTTTPGQNAEYTFSGSVGQKVSLNVTAIAYPTQLDVWIYSPSGVLISHGWATAGTSSSWFDTMPLPSTGTYRMKIDPYKAGTGAATYTLYDVHDLAGTIAPDGVGVRVTTTTPGQNAEYTFSGSVGQKVSLNVTAIAYPTQLDVWIYSPSGVLISHGWATAGTSSSWFDTMPLPSTGTYRMKIDPYKAGTGAATYTLYDVHDLAGTIAPDGVGVRVTTTTPGQNAEYTFSGSVGQTINFRFTGHTFSPRVDVWLYNPDGTALSHGWKYAGSPDHPWYGPMTLTQSGIYRIFVDPNAAATGTLVLTLQGTPASSELPRIYGLANVGETLIADSGPWSPSPTSVSYQWLRCDLGGEGCIELFGATEMQFAVTVADLRSTLRVRVAATNSFGTTSLRSLPTPSVLEALADLSLRYRPYLVFDSNEPWRPVEISTFLAEVFSGQSPARHEFCNASWQPLCEELNDPQADMMRAAHDADVSSDIDHRAYLDIHGSSTDYASADPSCWLDNGFNVQLSDCNRGAASAIYYAAGQDSAGRRYLDYWWFLRYNDASRSGPGGSVDNHEGDWEGVTVVYGSAGGEAGSVNWVGYDAHGELVWTPGDAVVAAGSVHPLAYVADGTHASYPGPCSSDCSQPPGAPYPYEAHHDGQAAWGNNADGTDSGLTCGGVCARRLNTWWTSWNGRWGRSGVEITDAFGWSPESPGAPSRTRFICAVQGYPATGCGNRPPGTFAYRNAADRTTVINPRQCAGWITFGVAALACDPNRLRDAINHPSRPRSRYLRLQVLGRRSGTAPGIAQVIGEPLQVGAKIHISGRGTPATVLTVMIRLGTRRYRLTAPYRAISSAASIEASITISKRNGRPFLTIGDREIRAQVTSLR